MLQIMAEQKKPERTDISFQCVHKSVCAAEKKIMKLLAKWGDK